MSVVHISEDEAVRDFAAVLAKVDAGDEVVIDRARYSVELQKTEFPRARTVAEIIADMPEHTEGIIDSEWADDVQEFKNRHREPLDASRWD